jgi:hypothetical protein
MASIINIIKHLSRTFVQAATFTKEWERLQLTNDDLRRLEDLLLENPQAGDVIPGTGSMRKLRFGLNNKGKRGSARICYVDFPEKEKIVLFAIFMKNEIEDLEQSEKNKLKELIRILERTL